MNITKPLLATFIAIGLTGCGSPKCGSDDTKQVLDIAFRNYLRAVLAVPYMYQSGMTYDTLEPEQKAAVDKQLEAIFPVTYSEIVETGKTDKSATCIAKVNTKINTHPTISYKVNKTEDGYLQVLLEKVE